MVRRMTTSPATLITGGSAGIGAAVARRLLRQGHRVAVTGRDRGRLDRLAADLGDPADLLALTADASDYEAVQSAVDATARKFGRLDTVVANAARGTRGDLADGDPAEWREMILTNVLGPALLIRAALPELRRTRGRIVLVGSVVGFLPSEGNLYGATKWAVTGLAENTRLMVTRDGIGVTLVSPGRVETPFWDIHGGPPVGPILPADQVADCIVWAIAQPAGVDVNTVTVRPVGAAY
jgi:NADP-dependent 3-hydroxy acid dehydrogenase YdfG